ncbi:MAG: DedA family protein, partial [Gemmataceae bacterium]
MDSSALYVYLVIFLLIIATGLGFPMPEELPIVAAGVMVGHASESPDPDLPLLGDAAAGTGLRWWIMLPVCIVAVVIGDSFLYGMGRYFGPRLLEKKWVQKVLTPEKRKNIEDNFQKYGVMVLLFARFLPTIRSPIFIMAGVTRLPYSHFVFADGIYAIPG